MRIVLINPNTSEEVTDLLAGSARAGAAHGTEIVTRTAGRGVPYISNRAEAAIGAVRDCAKTGAVAMHVVLSRRTSDATEAVLRQAFEGMDVTISGREDSGSYRRLLAQAEAFIVTPDSITMLCETCVTRKPVYALGLTEEPTSDGEGPRFVEAMVARGAIRVFEGEIDFAGTGTPLDEAARIAPILRRKIMEWTAG